MNIIKNIILLIILISIIVGLFTYLFLDKKVTLNLEIPTPKLPLIGGIKFE